MLKRLLILFALLAPSLYLLFFYLNPELDHNLRVPMAHFYVVTFTTFSAVVLSILLAFLLGREAQPRHVLAATAFAVIGTIFFAHGFATPGALIDHSHPAVGWSAWLTMFVGGLLFAITGLDGLGRRPGWLTPRRAAYSAVIFVLFYFAVAAFAPEVLTKLQESSNPSVRQLIFYASLFLWAAAALMLYPTWRKSSDRVDGMLAFVAVWLGTATISMHKFPVWNYSWWIYHVLLLGAFLIAMVILILAYEQLRQFRLAPYYLALSLVLTALLALAASALFTQFSFDLLVGEIRSSSGNMANKLASDLAKDLSLDLKEINASSDGVGRSDHMDDMLMQRLSGLPVLAAFVYSPQGIAISASQPEWVGGRVGDTEAFGQALRGETVVMIRPPSNNPAANGPTSSVDMIETFTPIPVVNSEQPTGESAAPAGVLVIIEEAPQLSQTTIQARTNGLLTAAVSMGLLFLILLSVVGRADRILTSRTEELRQVSNRLQTYSEWLLGKELLQRLLANPDALGLIRRDRTVLFMDVRGFTRWSETHSPEEVVQLLNRYYSVMETTMTKYAAIKFKFAADEAMAVFGDARQAALAALELRQREADLLEAHNLGVGIGLHTGSLVEGLLGSVEVKVYDVVGDTVNTAKRIENAAEHCEVLISEATQRLLGEAAIVGEARQLAVKGKDEPVVVFPLEKMGEFIPSSYI